MPPLTPRALALGLLGLLGGGILLSLLLGTGLEATAAWQALLTRPSFLAASSALTESPSATLAETIVWQLRAPRILLGLVVGSLLATSGAVMQATFRNPLADPGLLGVSAGAALAGAAALAAGLSPTQTALCGFAGALLTTLLVRLLARHSHSASLLLAGVAVNALATAGLALLLALSPDGTLRTITFWMLGSLAGATWDTVLIGGMLAVGMVAWASWRWRFFNALLQGEAVAAHLGFRVGRELWLTQCAVAIAVGWCVSLTGAIGFIGLMLPHVVRRLVGGHYRRLVPLSALAGGTALVLADGLARTLISPAELPVGVMTSLVGAPCFLWLLRPR